MRALKSYVLAFIYAVIVVASCACESDAHTSYLPVSTANPVVAAACGAPAREMDAAAYMDLERKWEKMFGESAENTRLVDRFVEQAESVTVPSSRKSPTLEKLGRWWRGALDRAIWGGALLLLGLLSLKLSHVNLPLLCYLPHGQRIFAGSAMIAMGCAYALLLPFIALIALALAVTFGLRRAISHIAQREKCKSSNGTKIVSKWRLSANDIQQATSCSAVTIGGCSEIAVTVDNCRQPR